MIIGKEEEVMKKRELKDKFKCIKEYSKRTHKCDNETRTAFSAVSEMNHRIPVLVVSFTGLAHIHC